MRIDHGKAIEVLLEEAERAGNSRIDREWEQRVRRLSDAAQASSKTFIAVLGTGLLAKATDLKVDALGLKVRDPTPGAYSARSLAQHVLAANAISLDIDLGVTGREPHNNQPFFRYDRITREMVVRSTSREALDILCECLEAANAIRSEREARGALRAFLYVRRKAPSPELPSNAPAPGSELELVSAIKVFVSLDSEGGKRAQGVAAGLLDVAFGESLVVTSRVNDPDRRVPGDIGVLSAPDGPVFERIVEVRDKQVATHDLLAVASKAERAGIHQAVVLAVAPSQVELDASNAKAWASVREIRLSVYSSWTAFVPTVLFRSSGPIGEVLQTAFERIYERLSELEVAGQSLEAWADWTHLGGR